MFTLNCRGRLMVIDKPLVMGIINVTPDSFYEGSRPGTIDLVLQQVSKMQKDGADIIDVGGQSTRPGSERIAAEQEIKRVIPVIEGIIKKNPDAIISIDTYQSEVAMKSVEAGASIVNDISAGTMDNAMIDTISKLGVPYICMHMKGTPANMQQKTDYENVTAEVLDFFINKIDELKHAGINDIIIDPGFGFAKTITQNFKLLKDLSAFKMLDKPILAGISRKSTIYKTLNITAAEALNGTTSLNMLALMNGANILRVHDVKEAKEAITLYQKYTEA